MSKQRQFSLVAIILSFLFIASRYFDPYNEHALLVSALISLVAAIPLVALFRPRYSPIPLFKTLFLPLSFLISLRFFYSLLPTHWWSQLLFFVAISLGTYLTIAISNIFSIASQFKIVPLYRAAFSLSFLLVLIELYFGYNFIFSLRLDFWQNAILVFLLVCLFLGYFFSVAALEEKELGWRQLLPFTLAAGWIIAQLAAAFSFWSLPANMISLYLVSFSYFLGGILQAAIRRRLFRPTLREYLGVGLGILVALSFLGSR